MNGESDLCRELVEKKINSKKFGKVLQLDGIPLLYFLWPSPLRRPFKDWREIGKIIKKGEPSRVNEFKTRVFSFALRNELAINEKVKLWISKHQRNSKINKFEKDVLFVVFTNQVFEQGGRLDFPGLGKVANILKKKGVKPLILLCDPLSNPFFKFRKYSVPLLYDYVDSEIVKESRNLSRKLNREWKKLEKSKLFKFQGKNCWKFIRNEMNFLFSHEYLFILITHYLAFKKVIEKHKIKLVCFTGGTTPELALLGAAHKLNVKTMYATHGHGIRRVIVLPCPPKTFKNVIFIAMSEDHKRKLIKRGVKNENVFVTGSPFFDDIVEFKKIRVKKGKKTVVFVTTHMHKAEKTEKNEYFRYIRSYLDQVSKVRDVEKIIVKLHSTDKDRPKYESIVRSLKLKNFEIEQRPEKRILYSILSNSDLLISFGSTVDIEGLMLDRNVIVIEGFKGVKREPYKKAVLQLEKNSNLGAAVERVLSDKETQEKLKRKRGECFKKFFYKIDGKAGERVAERIVSLIKS